MWRINVSVRFVFGMFVALALLAGLSTGQAQVTGEISGIVKDQTEGRLPGATVTIQQVETGRTRTVVTNDQGRYDVPGLAVGSYRVTAELPGFRTSVRSGVTLTVASHEVIDLVMQVGDVAESVEVTAEAPLVNTSSAMLSEIVDDKKVRDLPLNGRDISQLLLLQSEVTQPRSKVRKLITSNGLSFNISGQRDVSNVFLLDGTDIMDMRGSSGSAGGPLSGVETIQEFRVLTGAFSAEYGKATGGVITAVTKSGTNQLHGSAFEFLRNDNLDARNFFDPNAPPEFKRNQFGGTVGGPIVRDKAFFFGSYEGTRERLGQTVIRRVPSAAARASLLRNAQGQLIIVNPSIKPFLDFYPEPNRTDFGDGTAQSAKEFSQPTNEDFFTVKGDHQISMSNALFVRYTFSDSEKEVVTSNRHVTFPELDDSRNQFLTLQDTHVISPSILNTFRFGFSRTTPTQGESIFGKDAPSFVPGKGFGTIIVGAFDSDLGTDNSTPRSMIQNLFEYSDDVIWTTGRHSAKMGLKVQRYQQNSTFADRGKGEYTFGTIEDLLLGRSSRFQSATPDSTTERSFRFTTVGFYTQDDIQLTPTFALNLGLRYEFTTVPTENHGRLSNLRDLYNGSEYTVGAPFQNPGLMNFSPRLGLAWDPNGSGKTAIRAGASIFYQPLPNHAFFFASAATAMPPFFKTADLRASASNPLPFPNAFQTIGQPGTRIVLSPRAHEYEGISQPKVYRFNFNIQREALPNTAVTLGYAGALGRNLQRLDNFNTRFPKIVDGRITFDPREPLRNRNFQDIRLFHTNADSYYHALIVSANKRYSRGLQLQLSYTVSKSIDTASTVTGGDFPGFLLGERSIDFPGIDRGLSIFDTRQSFVFNSTYDLPVGAGKALSLSGAADKILGGWQINGIVTFASGNPISAEVNRRIDYDGDGNTLASAFVDFKPGGKVRILGGPDQYYDPSVFALPPLNTFGNTGRNIIIGPGLASVDFGLTKNTSFPGISEQFNLQFRAEFFNLFNHANFSQPDNLVFTTASGEVSGGAGAIGSTTTSSRQIQFGMKIQF